MAADLKVLNRRRGSLKTQLTRLTTFLKGVDVNLPVRESTLSAKRTSANKIRKNFEELRIEYYNVADDTQIDEVERSLLEVEEELEKVEVSLEGLLFDLRRPVSNAVVKNEVSENVKLPEIQLPRFSGRLEDWFTFKNQFLSIIDNQKFLNENQKLFYLQSSLIGVAKQVQTQDDTYVSLFKALTERFENRRLIVNTHVNCLLNIEKMKSDSAKELRALIDLLLKNVRALELLKLKTNELTEILLINLVVKKLDFETRKAFELSLTTKETPSWSEFLDFLQKRCLYLESMNDQFHTNYRAAGLNKSKSFVINASYENTNCILCKKLHCLSNCFRFKNMLPRERYRFVKEQRLCLLCLEKSHRVNTCAFKSYCEICARKHNSLLHFDPQAVQEKDAKLNSTPPPCSPPPVLKSSRDAREEMNGTFSASAFAKSNCVILSTAMVYINDASGNKYKVRALLDSGSMSNFISYRVSQMLNIKPQLVNVSVSTINQGTSTVKSKLNVTLSNSTGEFRRNLEFYSIPKITDVCPAQYIDIESLNIPGNIILADPQFFKPSKIDILLGAEVFFSLLKPEKLELNEGKLVLFDSVFGFVLSGSAGTRDITTALYCGFVGEEDGLNEAVKRFWEIESVDLPRVKSVEEKICDEHFIKNTTRDSVGRYMVKMPFKQDPSCLGDSQDVAIRRLNSLWKRLSRDTDYLNLYKSFLKEYCNMGHMTEISDHDEPCPVYYMPHHGVYRPDKSSTKLRVVFNASTLTTSGHSLNSIQLNGGVIQEDLFAIMVRFRKHEYAFIADIKQMYRNILIQPEQRQLQRIVWKEFDDSPMKIYQLNTVTYGTVSAPYLAQRTLRQLARDEGAEFPNAASIFD